VRKLLIAFLLLIFVPIGVSATSYWFGDRQGNWQTADRSSAGLLPTASNHPDALIRVYAARTVRWRGIFAVHSWIVFKEQDAARYARYDYTAWGDPIRTNGFAPDGRWFGAAPETVVAVDGESASRLIRSNTSSKTISFALMAITAHGPVQTQTHLFRPSSTLFRN
jgi:hypothetical protein